MNQLMSYEEKITRDQLAQLTTPEGTLTHRPIPHIEVVDQLIENLGFRHIDVFKDEYAVSRDGMRMFGIMELDTTFDTYGDSGCRFALGIRNSHDKSMRLAMTVGYRVFVCENMAFEGDFQPVLAKHTKNFNLIQALSWGVDEMQRHFEPMVKQVQDWKAHRLTEDAARKVIYQAFIEGKLDAPRFLARKVHDLYFNPTTSEFQPRTFWSLSNAFTTSFKELKPISQFKATAKLGECLGPK